MAVTGYNPLKGSTLPESDTPKEDFEQAVVNSQTILAMHYLVGVIDEMQGELDDMSSKLEGGCDCDCKKAPSRKTQKGSGTKKKSTSTKNDSKETEDS